MRLYSANKRWKKDVYFNQVSAMAKTSKTTTANTNFLHRMPEDLARALKAAPKIEDFWSSLTPLARNEWICWLTIVKKAETREKHLARLLADLQKGKHRPCCWPGCPHRRPEAAKYFSRKVG